MYAFIIYAYECNSTVAPHTCTVPIALLKLLYVRFISAKAGGEGVRKSDTTNRAVEKLRYFPTANANILSHSSGLSVEGILMSLFIYAFYKENAFCNVYYSEM